MNAAKGGTQTGLFPGDLVHYKGRGGSANSRSNVWRLIDFKTIKIGERYRTFCNLELVEGRITFGKDPMGPGFKHKYWLNDLEIFEGRSGYRYFDYDGNEVTPVRYVGWDED